VETVVTADREVYQAHAEDLIRYATVLVGADDAADVVSAVLVRTTAAGGLARLDDPRAYLFRAVLNEARNLHRSRRRGSVAVVRIGPAPAVRPADEEVDVDVIDAVMALPVRQRAVVYLAYWEGATIADAARQLGLRPATARRYLHLARHRLRRILDA